MNFVCQYNAFFSFLLCGTCIIWCLQEMEQFADFILPQDHPMVDRVRRVGNRLLQSNSTLPELYLKSWTVTLVDDNLMNCFVLPVSSIFRLPSYCCLSNVMTSFLDPTLVRIVLTSCPINVIPFFIFFIHSFYYAAFTELQWKQLFMTWGPGVQPLAAIPVSTCFTLLYNKDCVTLTVNPQLLA